MTNGSEKPRDYQIREDEKITSVMVYTQNVLVLGNVVTKEALRVSTWLKLAAAPKDLYIRDAQVISFNGGPPTKPERFRAILMPVRLVIAFHIRPPAYDPPDYDPTETNRKIEPVTALVGTFHFDGTIRLPEHIELDKFLDGTKDIYTSMYELEISNPLLPQMGVIRPPMALINNEMALYSLR